MRTASTRLLDEDFETLRGYCQDNNTNMNELLGSLVRRTLEGKIKPKPIRFDTRIPFCPKCGFLMFFDFHDDNLACIKCGYCFGVERIPNWDHGEARII